MPRKVKPKWSYKATGWVPDFTFGPDERKKIHQCLSEFVDSSAIEAFIDKVEYHVENYLWFASKEKEAPRPKEVLAACSEINEAAGTLAKKLQRTDLVTRLQLYLGLMGHEIENPKRFIDHLISSVEILHLAAEGRMPKISAQIRRTGGRPRGIVVPLVADIIDIYESIPREQRQDDRHDPGQRDWPLQKAIRVILRAAGMKKKYNMTELIMAGRELRDKQMKNFII